MVEAFPACAKLFDGAFPNRTTATKIALVNDANKFYSRLGDYGSGQHQQGYHNDNDDRCPGQEIIAPIVSIFAHKIFIINKFYHENKHKGQ